MGVRRNLFAQPNQFPGAVVLMQGGIVSFERASAVDFDPNNDMVSITRSRMVEGTANQPATYEFDEIAPFKLAPSMLVCLEELPEPQQTAPIGRRSVLVNGRWYQLEGEPQQVEDRMDIIMLVGQRNKDVPGWPDKQVLALFRLTDGVVYSWADTR
jgi:hypothetical protein